MSISSALRNRFRYRLDNLLSRGTWAALLVLGAVSLGVLILSAVLLELAQVRFTGSEGSSIIEGFWQSTLRVMDPGTMAADVGWGRRVLALLITLFGILVAGTLIGIIAAGVEQRVEQMQRGRSVVIESGHVVILGASSRLPVMVNQLTLANRKRRGNAIVVLADREPREMAEEVRAVVPDSRGSRLVFRFGDHTRRSDLAIAAVRHARVVIVSADDARSDASVVKAVVAVGAELGGFDRIPVVAELNDPETAASLSAACGGQVHTLIPSVVTARIVAFALGQPGLQQVVEELLDFRGSDIYIIDLGDLQGSSFGESLGRFAKAHPIGKVLADGTVELNPAPSTRLAEGDRLVVIADDAADAVAALSGPGHHATPTATRTPISFRHKQEHVVIVGWNDLGHHLLDQLRQTSLPGSTVEIVYDTRLYEPDDLPAPTDDALAVSLDPIHTDVWRPRNETHLAETTAVVFLAYRRTGSADAADSRTLLNLMVLSRHREQQSRVGPRLIAELLDAENVDLARITGAEDFIVSDAIASRIIVQLAGEPERRPVLLSLYAADGPSLHLVDGEDLGVTGEKLWHEVIDTVYARGLLAIGWRQSSDRGSRLTLNPHVDDRVELEPGDSIVVVG